MSSNRPRTATRRASANTLASMRPLRISGMVTPLIDVNVDGGINIEVVSESPSGVMCAIPAYLEMKEGEKSVVYVDDVEVLTREVQPGEVDTPLFFYLPSALFAPGVSTCYYQLTRDGQTTPEDPSVPLALRVKLNLPGGRDREPHLPDGHSELHIVQLPPELIAQGVVDAEWARKGVPITIPFYPDIAPRDVILMRWGTWTLPPHVVTQAQADRTDAIVIVADQDAILAGGDSAALELKYDVRDEVFNWASRHSKRTRIAVDAGAWRLDAPIIKEAINGVITLKDLNKQDVTVQVFAQDTDFEVGDTVTMTWIGTPFAGEPLTHTESKPVLSTPSIMEFKVPYADVRAIAMGSADASYVLTKTNEKLSSKRRFADVSGDVSLLPEPQIRELLGDILEPDTAVATVDIRYPGITNGDLVMYHWLGTTAAGQTYEHEDDHIISESEAESGGSTFYVGNEHIAVLDNGRLDLSYTVSNDSMARYAVSESEHLLIRVEAARATLPAPKVEEADPPDVLDPSKVFDVVHVLIDYLGTAKGDILTYYWRGDSPLGSTGDWLPITSPVAGKPLRFRVEAEYVMANIGRYVDVRYSLWRAATQRYDYSMPLKLLIGELVGELPPPKVVQAPDDVLNPMDALTGVDVRVSYPSMKENLDTITLKWLGTPGTGTSLDLELPGHASGAVTFRVPSPVIGANIGRPVTVSYEVTRYNFSTPSQALDLYVSDFQNPETELPRPRVTQATGDVLDLTTFTGDADALVDRWPFIALKQHLWLWLEGTTETGSAQRITLLDGVEINATQVANGLDEPLPRSELMKLGHATPASVICKVAFDGSDQPSNAIEFPRLQLTVKTRYDWLTPVISDVIDSKGSVPEGGDTFDLQVIVEGSATRGEQVELFDGSTSLGNADVGTDGVWRKSLANLATKDYHLAARALYPADPVSSLLRAFTVRETLTPAITRVTDSLGDVAHNGTTYDTGVTIIGKASPGQTVQLYDDTTALLPVIAVDGQGDWRQPIAGLTIATHNIKARALYGAEPESGTWTFQVEVAQPPAISSITDSTGEVPHNATTFDTSVTVSGTANAGLTVQLHDGNTPLLPLITVDGLGTWRHVLSNLSVASYNIKAVAQYGGKPESAVRAFVVAVADAPSITSITDSRGEVQHNGTTFDTSVTLTGTANANQTVQLYDGSTALPTVTPVNAQGIWTQVLSGLTVTLHTIKARALYGQQPESGTRAFTVAVALAPSIEKVTDSRGDVANNGTTFDTSVTVNGKATANLTVQLIDGNTPLTPVITVDGQGTWTRQLTGLTVAEHPLKVKALYGAQPESETWTVNVAIAVPPTITNITDSRGEVQPNGTTYDTSVTVAGKAHPNQTVQVYDGSTAIPPVTAVNAQGIWTRALSGLSVATHTIKAKASYATQPESAVRGFTVATHIAATLDSVRDSRGELPNGGETTDTTVTLQGRVTAAHAVQIFDNSSPKHNATAQANNIWTTTLAVGVGGHSVYARAVATGQNSNARSFTVKSPTPPLNFNTEPVTLSGKTYLIPGNPDVLPTFGPGTSVQHQATGGVPQFTYSSSNPGVAVVDARSGLVTVRGRGTATISVKDTANQTKSYTVTVTGVIHCFGLGRSALGIILRNASNIGARVPSMAELREIHSLYGGRWPMGNDYYWSVDKATPFPVRYWVKYLVTGAEGQIGEIVSASGVGIK